MPTTPKPRTLEYLPLDEIQVADWNPKDHESQLIQDSVAEHGFVTPLVLDDRSGKLVAGHGRRDELLRARAAGEEAPDGIVDEGDGRWLVPVVRGWRSRTKRQAEQFLVADNATSAAGGFDVAELAPRVSDWLDGGKLKGTGYTPRAAKDLLASVAPPPRQSDPEVPDEPVKPISKPGDVWLLGDHRLMCGDSTSADDMAVLMNGEQADLVVTSPPYNVDVEYEDHDDKTLPWPEYRAFLSQVATVCIGVMASGRAFVWNVGVPAGAYHYRQAVMLEDAGLQYVRQLIWRKVGVVVPTWHFTLDNPVVRQLTPNYQHEVVYLFAKGQLERSTEAAVINGLLEHDVFTINQTESTRDLPNDVTKPHSGASNLDRRAQKAHPAAYPLALPRTFIGHLADPGAVVLDPFGGSGTTLLAAHALGRRGFCMEKGPGYTDVACRRWQSVTGVKPILERTGRARSFGPAKV